MAGYSGKPLAEKLGIKEAFRLAVIHEPDGFRRALSPIPDGVEFIATRAKDADVIVLFAKKRSDLARLFPRAIARTKIGGMVWVAWPKKASGEATDITEDVVRAVCLPSGWVDVKVCAIDDIWSGLKFLKRRA
jgi:hypothetical protein